MAVISPPNSRSEGGTWVNCLIVALVAMLGVIGNAPAASAVDGAWESDANIGAVVPYSKYRKSVKGNVGGSVGFAGGYRFFLREDLALSLLAQPQFTVMPTEQERSVSGDNETASMFIGTGGPKLTLLGDPIETWFSAQGGWYHDMTGPIGDEGPGWNAGMGVNYRITPATSVGLYGNYHWADIDASVEDSGPRRFIVSGFNVVHAYLAPEPAGDRSATATTAAAAGAEEEDHPARGEFRLRQGNDPARRGEHSRRGHTYAAGRGRDSDLGRGSH